MIVGLLLSIVDCCGDVEGGGPCVVTMDPSGGIIKFQIVKLCTGKISDNEFALYTIAFKRFSISTPPANAEQETRWYRPKEIITLPVRDWRLLHS